MSSDQDLAKLIRDVPDFPKQGILFKDITTLLKDKDAFKKSIDLLAERFANDHIDKVVAAESRGFIFGAPLAYLLNAGFVPVRKLGRLPAKAIRAEYTLEYGTNFVEIHVDAIEPGEKVLIVDDLLATGGTVGATIELVKKLEGDIVALAFLVELSFLKGRERLKDYRIETIITY
ncbi:adenine phosphoribosyltransferase [Thermobaculum terrenum ATCC BAA-798]|uniref:Adenine phosphoribosyltransferase n=1 Tax=Thermobaculum terrenum (strain ATCC BAA-798 / CCMEE 7001 / YNP1) TaxID=525904 RepID=D1CFK3_THET1|nr:adenine phosphoribosyltransferase [Thermobaculum terrenum]ACZ41709.1 adenine phosphoribosyltransferase [Thermobaculum terrenum ATCC BAA-798]